MDDEQWGDYRDWEHWQKRSAAQVAQDICRRCGGRWPSTVKEWEEAAAHYGFLLFIIEGLKEPAMTIDNCIYIRKSRRAAVLNRRICHEIAEAITQEEAGIRQFNFVSDRDEYHHVAQLVERETNAQIAARQVARQKRIDKTEQHILHLQQLMLMAQVTLEKQLAAMRADEEAVYE